MTKSSCAQCGGPLPVQTGRGRRRSKCANCSPSRGKPKTQPQQPTATTPVQVVGLLAATRAELEAAGRDSSSPGQAAILLANLIEFGDNSGSAVAQMVRQLHDTMARALADAAIAVDPVDELRQKREARQRGA